MHPLVEAMADMKEQEALKIVDELLAQGEDPNHVLDLSSEAMQVVGERYQEGTYFLPELIMSGEMLRKIGEILYRETAQAGAGSPGAGAPPPPPPPQDGGAGSGGPENVVDAEYREEGGKT